MVEKVNEFIKINDTYIRLSSIIGFDHGEILMTIFTSKLKWYFPYDENMYNDIVRIIVYERDC